MQSVLELPGVCEAVMQESLIRDAAFFHLTESIAGYPAKPLSLRQYYALCIAGSPLIPPFRITKPSELSVFLWAVNPAYCTDQKARAKFLKKCRHMSCPKMPFLRTKRAMRRWGKAFMQSLLAFSRTLVAARDFMDQTLMDSPGSIGEVGYQPSFYSGLCAVAANLAREYGGGIDIYLDMPLKIIFQLRNERLQANSSPDNPAILFNRLSERAINRALEKN